MTIPKQAIEKAIEGGWRTLNDVQKPTFTVSVDGFVSLYFDDTKYPDLSWQDVALDPGFWKCLGQTLGWPEDNNVELRYFEWAEQHWYGAGDGRMIQFARLIATEGDIEKFWEDILK